MWQDNSVGERQRHDCKVDKIRKIIAPTREVAGYFITSQNGGPVVQGYRNYNLEYISEEESPEIIMHVAY